LIVKRFLEKHPSALGEGLGSGSCGGSGDASCGVQGFATGETPFDNITVLKHPYGCSQLGKDHANTRQILADIVKHPHAAGVLVFGLGCENNTIEEFRKTLGEVDESRVKFLIAQQVEDEIETGAKLIEEIWEIAKNDKREQIGIENLKIGLKCGGSDGFSGITANPLLGKFSDFLVLNGGATVLTEVPEMFGAETILMERAKDKETFEKIVKLINGFKQYFISNGENVYENPSPGNKAGGITTLEDKSLGCTQKSGICPVSDVLEYGETISSDGLNLVQGPGNDVVASSALAASGCQIVLFTTGRGTPFGTFGPTVKVSTNSPLAAMKRGWIDFDAGSLVESDFSEVISNFVDYVLKVASGEKTKNEINGEKNLAIFKTGVTL
jgi:altronate hydrolase